MEEKINEGLSKMYFIGVTTSKSIINKIFPAWMNLLNNNLQLECFDIPINANATTYRECINKIKSDETIRGALVTTHKIPIYNSANDLFDILHNSSFNFKEIGCIYKKNNNLIGEATDIITVKEAFQDIWNHQHYSIKKDVQICILGCGGAGVALAYAILSLQYSNIIKVFMIDNKFERLQQAQNVLNGYDTKSILAYYLSEGILYNDKIVSSLMENAIVVNATGMGKDVPGAPISKNVILPSRGCLWEYNYRGDLEILDIAYAQKEKSDLTIINGFNYFLYGWTTVISRVLDIKIDTDLFNLLSKEAYKIYTNL